MESALDEALEDALDVLSSAREWHLSARGWEDVAALVDELAAAVAEQALTAIRAATAELELAGPVRVVTSIEDPPQGPAPSPVLDRINEVIEEIDKAPQGESAVDDVPDSTR